MYMHMQSQQRMRSYKTSQTVTETQSRLFQTHFYVLLISSQ